MLLVIIILTQIVILLGETSQKITYIISRPLGHNGHKSKNLSFFVCIQISFFLIVKIKKKNPSIFSPTTKTYIFLADTGSPPPNPTTRFSKSLPFPPPLLSVDVHSADMCAKNVTFLDCYPYLTYYYVVKTITFYFIKISLYWLFNTFVPEYYFHA